MKLTVLGGGGVRSAFLAKSLAYNAHRIGLTEVVFLDNSADNLAIFGEIARYVFNTIRPDIQFSTTTDPVAALQDANYIITTLRVGGDESRIRDERIALEHNTLGQETTGAGGFAMAMRSIPAILRYCRLIEEHAAEDAILFNFTNPSGLVTEAIIKSGFKRRVYGICDAPSGMLHQFADLYGVSADRIVGECYGLNHLSFFRSIKIDGKEIMPELISRDDAYRETDMRFFGKDLLEHMGCVLNEYLYYFYYREQAVSNILHAPQTRGEVIEDINRQMTAELSKMDIENDFESCLKCFEKWYGRREDAYMANETGIHRNKAWTFDVFAPDAGGYAGVALRFIDIVESGKAGSMILCAPNQGAIPGLRDNDIVEITCDIAPDSCTPHKVTDGDERALELIRRVKAYERLASKAIREKSRTAAIDCLTLHPLVNSYSLAVKLVDSYIALNAGYSDGWK